MLIFLFGVAFFMFAFASKRKHLLATLLRLEGLMFIVFGLFYFLWTNFFSIGPLLFIFLTLIACEGALGLAILVSVVRSTGRDNLNSINLLTC
jgi:NADH:ubiquinone oxidoreductase subunit K